MLKKSFFFILDLEALIDDVIKKRPFFHVKATPLKRRQAFDCLSNDCILQCLFIALPKSHLYKVHRYIPHT